MYARTISGPHQVETPEGRASLNVHTIGPHPILLHFLHRMAFLNIIRSCLGTPADRVLDHGQTLAVLVQNIILSPAPLYRIAEWAAPLSPEALGLSATEKESINDDRVGRSLDALVSPRGRSVFFRLALHIIKQFELDTRRIHNDTTTVTLFGEYRRSVEEPRITYGINKDHRPDLKQLVFGLNVCGDGAVPISHEVYSGNRTDDTIHRSNVDHLRKLLSRDDFIYVADCKLCTTKNLHHVDSYGGKFVTVLPRTRAEDKRFRAELRRGNGAVRWRQLMVTENKRRSSNPPEVYWSTPSGPQETKEGYRIVWCRSAQKRDLDAQRRETELQKAEAELFDLGARLNRGRLKQRAAIKKDVDAILKKYRCREFLRVTIGTRTQVATKHLRRGRPKEGDPVRTVRIRMYYLKTQRDKQALRREARTDGVFPLVTNLPSRRASKKKVLLIYKYQPYVEKRHSLFKTELQVAPVYLKKPRRAAGLLHATFLAMTLDALIERSLRQGMQREGIEKLPILPEGRNTKTPTTARLLEVFSDVAWYEFERGGEAVTFPVRLTKLQKLLLKLLEIDSSSYA
jgi:transposase